jgi:hypothetical protein
MTKAEAKKLTFLISQIDEGNHCLMGNACVDASKFFYPWRFEVIKSNKYEWTYQVKVSTIINGSLWETTSEEIEKEIDNNGEAQNDPIPD